MKGQMTPFKVRLLGWLLLAALLLALVLATSRYLAEQSQQSPWVAVILNQQTYQLPRSQLRGLADTLVQLSAAEMSTLEQQLEAWMDVALAVAFTKATTGVDRYLDWYYSMPGSYLRLLFALQGSLEEFTAQKLTAHVLHDSGFADALAELAPAYEAKVLAELEVAGHRIASALEPWIASYAIDEGSVAHSILDMDTLMSIAFAPSPEDLQRWQTSAATTGVAGASAVTMLAYRTIAPRLVQAGGNRAAQKAMLGFASRLAPRTAAAITAGGTAAGAAAPSGPGALVVGGIVTSVTLATFVATDFALLKAEEATLRPGKERALRDSLALLEEDVRLKLASSHTHTFNLLTQQLDAGLNEAWRDTGEPAYFHILSPPGYRSN